MAIPVMSSQDLNKQFLESKQRLDETKIEITQIKNDLGKKLMIANYGLEFATQKMDALNTGILVDEKLAIFDSSCIGEFEKFGMMVHPKYKKEPIDIFNLKLLSGDTMFRKAMTAKINNVENKDYIKVLMSDNSIEKSIIFEELKEDIVKLEYELDNTVALGMSRFNTIEIDPYVYGAYDILNIELYTQNDSGEITTEPTMTLNGYQNIGKTRIVLPEKIRFSKAVITFKINFESEVNGVKIYPFGLKHIYFMEADFIPTSNVIIKITSDKYMEYVYEDIKLFTTNGVIETTCEEYGIKLYTDYEGGDLVGRIYTSSDAGVNRIAKNTRSFYASIPLIKNNIAEKTTEYLCLNGIRFNYIDDEQIII